MTGQSSARYICAECGHHCNLSAAAEAVAFGPLGADGYLDTHDDVCDDIVHESSIQCAVHPDAPVRKRIGDIYCGWTNCQNPRCIAGILPATPGVYGTPERPCGVCKGAAGSWNPVADRCRA